MKDLLIEKQWIEFTSVNKPVGTVSLLKKIPGHRECQSNPGDKQVVIHIYDLPQLDVKQTAEVECSGETKDGTWVILSLWALDNPSIEIVESKVEEILKYWDYIYDRSEEKNKQP